MDQKNLADLYGLPPVPWERALDALERGNQTGNQTSFLTTTRPDGRPHVAGVGAVWDGDMVYFVSGPGTRKSQNVAQNPSCVMAMSFEGIDLIVEGEARRVTDDETLQRLAKRYADSGWPATVEDEAFTYEYSAPSAGPPPWYLYAITPTTVYGVLAEAPGGAMRWRFGS